MKNIWIGIDDTDSRSGGCTTYVAYTMIDKINDIGYDLIGLPRLVRLNPNIPWKTRGNGAISLQIGIGCGSSRIIGKINGKKIISFSKKKNKGIEINKIKKILEDIFLLQAKIDDENTNPGFVILNKKPEKKVYLNAVKDIVTVNQIKKILKNNGFFKGYKNSRGLIGATASIAWQPLDITYELIAYREKKNWGTKRKVDDKATIKMDKKIKSTFDNFDYIHKHNRLVPSSPCPVLFGIRGENIFDLIKAKDMIISEKMNGWIVFETNQGTDEHIQSNTISDIKAYSSVKLKGMVSKKPHTIKGGHVFFSIKDSTEEIDCAAYEPTKEFRDIIRSLEVGDSIIVYGGVRQEPLTINLEKIKILDLKEIIKKVENPICKSCGKHMKSKGKNQGFKCVICGKTSGRPKIKKVKREIKTGFYEVPVCARRHLSKPLKRIFNEP